jgi:hypothetical protein
VYDDRRQSRRKEPGMAEYWYCLEHQRVEGPEGCKNADRLGPYPSEAEAARALEKVEERNEQWDNDPAWNDDVREE